MGKQSFFKRAAVSAAAMLAVAAMLAAMAVPATAHAADDVASGTWGTCEWEIDAGGKLTIGAGAGADITDTAPWASYANSITSVVCSGYVTAPQSLYRMFRNCPNITSVDLSCLDTYDTTSMKAMFSGCSSLKSLNLSSFYTSNVETMQSMFYGCKVLASLDISSFDTSNVTSMRTMFYDCTSLTSLSLAGFDTSNVTNMLSMFRGCAKLKTLNLASFDTSNVEDMTRMFYNCKALASLNLSGFDTSKVTDMSNMFYMCSALRSLDLSSFDTSKVTNISNMFFGCTSLASVKLGPAFSFTTSNTSCQLPKPSGTGKWALSGKNDAEPFTPAELANCYDASMAGTWVVYRNRDLGDADVILPSGCAYKFMSKKITPAVKVTLDGKVLKKGTDYKLVYHDNYHVGEAWVDVIGMGEYAGAENWAFFDIEIRKGSLLKSGGATWRVTKVYGNDECDVSLKAAPNKKTVVVDSRVGAEGQLCYVHGIDASAFAKARKCRTVVVASPSLSKTRVKGCLKGSKVKKVDFRKLCAVGYEYGFKTIKKYKKSFSKGNVGKKVKFIDPFKKTVVKKAGRYNAAISRMVDSPDQIREIFASGNRLFIYSYVSYFNSGGPWEGKYLKLAFRAFKITPKTKYYGQDLVNNKPMRRISKKKFLQAIKSYEYGTERAGKYKYAINVNVKGGKATSIEIY